MEVLQFDHSGSMDAIELAKYGRFSWLQKLKFGGTGSEKIIYISGIPAFDSWVNFNQDDNYCSLEIFPFGFICRYQAAIQRQAAIGIMYEDLISIELNQNNKFVIIKTKDETIQFKISTNFKSINGFIKKLKAQKK